MQGIFGGKKAPAGKDLTAREAELDRRERELKRKEAALAANGGTVDHRAVANFPPCMPLVHHDIINDIPDYNKAITRACGPASVVMFEYACSMLANRMSSKILAQKLHFSGCVLYQALDSTSLLRRFQAGSSAPLHLSSYESTWRVAPCRTDLNVVYMHDALGGYCGGAVRSIFPFSACELTCSASGETTCVAQLPKRTPISVIPVTSWLSRGCLHAAYPLLYDCGCNVQHCVVRDGVGSALQGLHGAPDDGGGAGVELCGGAHGRLHRQTGVRVLRLLRGALRGHRRTGRMVHLVRGTCDVLPCPSMYIPPNNWCRCIRRAVYESQPASLRGSFTDLEPARAARDVLLLVADLC